MWFRIFFIGVLLTYSINIYAEAPINSQEKKSSAYIVDATGKYYFPSVLKNKFLNLSFMNSSSKLFDEFKANQEDAIRAVLVDFILKDTTQTVTNVPALSNIDLNSFLNNLKITFSISKMLSNNLSNDTVKYTEILNALKSGDTIDIPLANTFNKGNLQLLSNAAENININSIDILKELNPLLKNIEIDSKNPIFKNVKFDSIDFEVDKIYKIESIKNDKIILFKELDTLQKNIKSVKNDINIKKNNLTNILDGLFQLPSTNKVISYIEDLESKMDFIRSEIDFSTKNLSMLDTTKEQVENAIDNLSFIVVCHTS